MLNQRRAEYLNWTNYLLHLLNSSMEVNTYIFTIFFCLHTLSTYVDPISDRSSKDYAERSEAGNFLRDNVADINLNNY